MKKDILILALGIALLPPIWAVIAPFIGVTTGAVALISAAIFVAANGCIKNAVPISLGFVAGLLWTLLAVWLLGILPINASVSLFIVLCVLGGIAVIISCSFPKIFFLPSWLGGWAIGLTVIAPLGISGMGTLPWQLLVSMLIGVWYVGLGVGLFQKVVTNLVSKKQSH